MADELLQIKRLTISFTSKNADKVNRLENHLNELGIKLIRYDKELKSQDNIQLYMEHMLDADKIIILLSREYLESSFCVYELIHFRNMEHKLIRIYVDDEEADLFKTLKWAENAWKQKQETSAPAGWLEREIKKQDLNALFYEIESIYKLKYIRYNDLFNTQGERQFLESLEYTPEKYVSQLNAILQKELWTEREFEFDSYLKTAPANDVFYLKKALSYEKESYLEAAVYFLQKSILLNERFLPAYLELYRIYLKHSEKQYLFNRQQLFKILDYTSQCSPNSKKMIYKVQGMLCYNDAKIADSREDRLKLASQAIHWFEIAEKLDKEDCTIYNGKGEVYELLEEIAHAAQSYEKAINLNPQYYQAYNNLALLYSKYLRDYDSAIKFYRKCLEIQPDYIYALNGLAILLEQKDIDSSIELYIRLICRDSMYTEGLTNLGLIVEEIKGDDQIAGCIYKIALEKEPNSVPKNFNYGNLLRKTNAPCEMVERYLGYSLEKLPASPMTNFAYGMFLLRESKLKIAKSYFEKAYQVGHKYQPAFCMIKYLEGLEGKSTEHLISEIEAEIAAYDKVYPLIYNYLGILYQKLGDGKMAGEFFEKGTSADSRLSCTSVDLDWKYLEKTFKLWADDRIYKNRPVDAIYDRDRHLYEEISARMFSRSRN